MVQARIEGQSARRQQGESALEGRLDVEIGRVDQRDRQRGIPASDLPHPLHARRGCQMRVEHRCGMVEPQVDVGDDTGTDPGGNFPPCRLLRDVIGEARLADRTKFGRPVLGIIGVRVHVDRGQDAMPAGDVGRDFIEEIGSVLVKAGSGPEMVMRVDDLQIGLDDVLDRLREPAVARVASRDRVRHLALPAQPDRTDRCYNSL